MQGSMIPSDVNRVCRFVQNVNLVNPAGCYLELPSHNEVTQAARGLPYSREDHTGPPLGSLCSLLGGSLSPPITKEVEATDSV